MPFGNPCAMVRDSGVRSAAFSLRAALAAASFALTASCAAPQPSPPLTGASQGTVAMGAAVTAIAAGAIWAVGGGCRLQGCPYGSYCNQKSGFCDVRRCDQGCPEGTVCNEGLGRCQASTPLATPNDFLPQDDARMPPGTH
jgi:hypothetical protein